MLIHDLIGIGFGPSNLALAIALDELQQGGPPLETLFIERQRSFTWHRDMLLDGTHMQVSFLKDLATLRNPASRFTFINYLHEKQRLQDFINLKTFFPSRREFNDYFAWAAAQFEDRCAYGEEVIEVLPEQQGGKVTLLRVRSRDSAGAVRERLTRNLALGIGGTPSIPACFAPLRDDSRVFHSSGYLRGIAAHAQARHIAVLGAGQSAAEIFMDLHGRPHGPRVDLILRAQALKPSDDSPFVNEIFNPDFVDHVYGRTEDERDALLREFRHTNYACPDLDLIQRIFQVFYDQKINGAARHRLLRRHEVEDVRAGADGIELALRDLDTGHGYSERYDAVVLATGYARAQHRTMLAPLAPYLPGFAADRHYRLHSVPEFQPMIFLQGACETTHGLSDTLLSVTAVRTGEIGQVLAAACRQAQQPDLAERRALA
ncbi:lysine N(6)-hydroxylase/L-ornithine N(5)-oxygenase family protein [Chitiniphilus purpureus]|uniref:Lysine N(6)-hydroxylase/L-ornithine N(5)-oxygenase family protein n=1 Tax=Chitiniphilus purpureus TaxID=2981137 RepID=A0ABY6DNC0_9NEIS|nr:lysine N(6)-hydroxylase/L-ornithine N(5)-oxygenase family protein [Chitiniphilus sp. CD1]UXY15512.1 lysine N(6)-hydroxylase/L-ornithine N(5)-oxygenase family protein [Chitiniphilus sp. CD1]